MAGISGFAAAASLNVNTTTLTDIIQIKAPATTGVYFRPRCTCAGQDATADHPVFEIVEVSDSDGTSSSIAANAATTTALGAGVWKNDPRELAAVLSTFRGGFTGSVGDPSTPRLFDRQSRRPDGGSYVAPMYFYLPAGRRAALRVKRASAAAGCTLHPVIDFVE